MAWEGEHRGEGFGVWLIFFFFFKFLVGRECVLLKSGCFVLFDSEVGNIMGSCWRHHELVTIQDNLIKATYK